MSRFIAGIYDPCPCGSGQKLKFCCLDRIKKSPKNSIRVPVAVPKISLDQSTLFEPCPCQSGKKYRRCCYPRTFFDPSKPAGGIPEPFLQQAALDRAIKRYESRPSRFDTLTIERAEVGHSRVHCAPMQPHGNTLDGTLAPPTAWQIEAKYEAIRNANPDGVTELVITFSYPEPYGIAEAQMLVDADEHFRLEDGRVVSVLDLFRGMSIRLEEGSIGTLIHAPERRYEIPIPPLKHHDGMWNSRVIGHVKHTSYEILEWCLAGQIIRGTPGHIVWSESRQWWVRACELIPGEIVRGFGDILLPVESVGPLRTKLVEVFGIEVEYFHNYYVGTGNSAMLVHNGPPCFNRPAVAEALEKGTINQTSKAAAGVARPPQHHIFPQANRAWFKERGVDIDKYTVKLDQGTHEALHFGGGPGKGGGWWNEQTMKTLIEKEAALGRKLIPQEIEAIGKDMMIRARISDLPIIPVKEVLK